MAKTPAQKVAKAKQDQQRKARKELAKRVEQQQQKKTKSRWW